MNVSTSRSRAARAASGVAGGGRVGERGQRRADLGEDARRDVLGDGEVQRLLAAEVIDDRREVGVRRLGDLARAGALEAEPAEHVERSLDQLCAGLGAAVPPGAAIGR